MDIPLKPSGGFDLSPEVTKRNNEMRAYYINYMEMGDGLGQKINLLVLAIHKENPDWSLNKIAQYICLINQDLDRFSKRTVYNKVSDENRIILDVKKTKPQRALPSELLEAFRQQKGKQVPPSEEDVEELQNKVTEEKFANVQTIVPEESSSSTSSSAEEFAVAEEEELEEDQQEEIIIYDNPEKLIQSYEEQIIKINKEYERLQQKNEELETKYNEIIEPYQVKESIIVNDQEIPLIMTADPFRRTITVELDQKEVKKLKRM